MFRATSTLLLCRITFFTRAPCSLCDTAKAVVHEVRSRRDFEYHEIDVMTPGASPWKEAYEFDTPVIHVDKAGEGKTTLAARKLMHRFQAVEVERLLDEVEQSA